MPVPFAPSIWSGEKIERQGNEGGILPAGERLARSRTRQRWPPGAGNHLDAWVCPRGRRRRAGWAFTRVSRRGGAPLAERLRVAVPGATWPHRGRGKAGHEGAFPWDG